MLDIAIPMYNAVEYSQLCVTRIRQTTAGIPYKIHVLNNGSTDATGSWLSGVAEPDIEIQTVATNQGAPRGKNIILNHIHPTDFVLFIDNDIELLPEWYAPFFSLFASDPRTGVAGIEGYNVWVRKDHRDLARVAGDGVRSCDILRGCFMFARGEVVARLGRFDENCGMYWHDDDDFCIRAIGEGYRNYQVPTGQVLHHESRSSSTTYPDVRNPAESARVQQYLVQKWRRLGLVDPDGRPRCKQQ